MYELLHLRNWQKFLGKKRGIWKGSRHAEQVQTTVGSKASSEVNKSAITDHVVVDWTGAKTIDQEREDM